MANPNPFYEKPHRAQRVRGATPPAATAPKSAPESIGPYLWLFTHAVPKFPATLTVTVSAPTHAEARAVAYLIAEDFSQKAIGQIKAQGI